MDGSHAFHDFFPVRFFEDLLCCCRALWCGGAGVMGKSRIPEVHSASMLLPLYSEHIRKSADALARSGCDPQHSCRLWI